MKHFTIIALLLFSLGGFGQTAPPITDTLGRFDERIWVRATRPEIIPDTVWRKWKTRIDWDSSGPTRIACQHIYVAVEATEVKPQRNGSDCLAHYGKREGKEIVCIKCHHVTKQVVDHGSSPFSLRSAIILPNWDGKLIISDSGPATYTHFYYPAGAYEKKWADTTRLVNTKDAFLDKIKSLSDKKKKRRCHK